ncbi:hypothetical protein F7C95_00290 [Opitutia bacterium ISCC 51]|nr:hypothetical protein F7C95_00290 [Opitutae bacterium ISCC 51]QXD28458.1 hypothetical protein GA003_00285 [Opitutae bacterium ISCC 52]
MGQNLYSSLSIFILGMIAASVAATAAPDFESQIAPIFEGHCLSCHNSTDAEGDFVLQTKAEALEHPDAILPGHSLRILETIPSS